MIAGLVLKQTEKEDSLLALLGEETECITLNKNTEIVEAVKNAKPDVLAADAGVEEPRKNRTEKEKELEEEGYRFTPATTESKKVRRMEALKAHIFEEMGADAPEIIRFDPFITADELAIHSDEALESYGVDTEDIRSAEQFDAMLGAVTARFYQQNSAKDLGVIVPETLEDMDETGKT